MQDQLSEVWVRSGPDSYLPIHLIAQSLGETVSLALPFIHSISGRDITSYPYFTSKKGWLSASCKLDIHALADYGETQNFSLPDELMRQVTRLAVAVQSKLVVTEDEVNLAQVRANKFLHSKSVMLKMLPATEGAFLQHVLRSALAVLIDKQAHVARPDIPGYHEFGWILEGSRFVPLMSLTPLWPVQMEQALSCNCKKGCIRNCPCAKRGVPCYIGCRCTGTVGKCKIAHLYLDNSGSDSD